MIFVDTNYFLRLLLKDIKDQYKQAKDLFLLAEKNNEKLISSQIVFFELFWVLGSSYKSDKQTLIDKLDKILKLNVEFDGHQQLVESVNLFKKLNLSLEDCYNLVFAKGRNVNLFKTFDVRLSKAFYI